jgi:hypothetical protein
MHGRIHRQCCWMQGTCGLNRPSAKALGPKKHRASATNEITLKMGTGRVKVLAASKTKGGAAGNRRSLRAKPRQLLLKAHSRQLGASEAEFKPALRGRHQAQ